MIGKSPYKKWTLSMIRPINAEFEQKTNTVDTRRWLLGIIALSVLLRLAAALYLGNTVVDLPGTADQLSYHNLALRLLGGHGFSFGDPWWPATPAGEPTAHWSYLYTLFLTAVYALVGPNPLVARIIQAVAVGVLMPWLVFQLAAVLFAPDAPLARQTKLLANGEKVGLAAAGITAVYIYFVYYAAALMTESFYITAILWVFLLAIRMSQKAAITWRDWLLFGLALGITILLRQVFMLFTPFLLLWLWFAARPNPLKFAIPLIVVAAMILPWTIRNYLAFDYFVLLNTNSGYAFFWGNHPIHGTTFVPILPSDEYFRLIPPDLLHLNEAELDSALMDLAMEHVLSDPVRYLLLSLSRIPPYFQFWPSGESSLISNISRVASFGLFLPFMVYGLFYVLRLGFQSLIAFLRSPFALIFGFVLVYTGLHLLTWALVRYRLPVDAFLILFAGVSVWALWENGRRRWFPSRSANHLPVR
jgi:hypothetical protein